MTKLKQKAGSFAESLRENWRALSTLVKMQLKEKMDLGYMRTPRKLIFKLVWLLIEFVAITAIIAVIFYFIKLLSLFSLVHDIPVSVVSIAFAIMLLLSLVTDTLGLMKSLYFSKDNTVLLTLPATPSLVFFSKLATYYIYELRKSFMFTIPMFIAYGIIKGYSLYYYPWLILMFVLISVIPVLFAALLSIPTMFGYIFINRVKILQYVLYTVLGAGAVLLVWYLIGLIPENINFVESWGNTYWEIQAFLTQYTKTFAPIYVFTELIVGKTVGLTNVIFHSSTLKTLLILFGIGVVLLVLCFVCSKPLFCRMASTPFEFRKNNSIKEKKNRKLPPFISAIKKEFTVGLRSNSFLTLGGILIIIMPMAIYLLNKLYSAMNTRFLGTQMTICFNVLIILLIMLMTNIDMASVYSRDGSSSYLNKVQPAPYSLLLYSKLFFPMIIALIGTIFTVNIFAIESSLDPRDAVLIGVSVYGFYVAHLFSSAESDIMNPQYKQYATFSEQANNPNESRSGIMAVIISAVVFAIALFFSSRADEGTWIKIAGISLAFAGLKVFTYISKIKAFYKEKQ
jgi:ABC-2 type transport system permease protein